MGVQCHQLVPRREVPTSATLTVHPRGARERTALGLLSGLARVARSYGGPPLVPRDEMANLDLKAAREQAALLTAWVNDVYSLPKELAARDPLNLVVVLANEHAVAIEDALALAVEVYNSDLSSLERVVADLRQQQPSVALDGYLEGLLAWVHGNRHWTKLCGRYL